MEEDLTPEQQELWEKAKDFGYELGYEDGFDAGVEADSSDTTDYDSGYDDGFSAGAKAEQSRIQFVLNMMFESSLNMGHGNKAVQYKHVMDLLRPINIDYSEEAYKKDMDNNGF